MEPIPELTMVRIPESAHRRIKQLAVAKGIKLWEAVELRRQRVVRAGWRREVGTDRWASLRREPRGLQGPQPARATRTRAWLLAIREYSRLWSARMRLAHRKVHTDPYGDAQGVDPEHYGRAGQPDGPLCERVGTGMRIDTHQGRGLIPDRSRADAVAKPLSL